MSEPETDGTAPKRFAFRRVLLRGFLAILLIVIAVLIVVFLQRETIVRNIVAAELGKQGISASYDIERLSLDNQVLRNIVIGNPGAPDATVKRLEVELRPVWGGVAIKAVRAEGVRLFGSYKDGAFSLGTLDRYLKSGSDKPPQLPDFPLTLSDARAKLDTDYGVIGIAASGSGNLRYDFTGSVAAISNELAYAGCSVIRPTLYGKLSFKSGRPGFDGPVRLQALRCPSQKLALGNSAIQTQLSASKDFSTLNAQLKAALGPVRFDGDTARSVDAALEFVLDRGKVSGNTDVVVRDVSASQIRSGAVSLSGEFAARNFKALPEGRFQGEFSARQIIVPDKSWQYLKDVAVTARQTPFGALITKFAASARAQSRNMAVAMPVLIDHGKNGTQILLRRADARSVNGMQLASANNVRIAIGDRGLRSATGEIAVSGTGFPQLFADFESTGVSSFRVRARMAPYVSGSSSLAMPLLIVRKSGQGGYGFAGSAVLSGPLPGGYVRNLRVPVSGGWAPSAGLFLYDSCQTLRFDALKYTSIRADARTLRICPNESKYIVRQSGGAFIVSARLPDGQFSGYLGNTPIDIQARRFVFSLPGRIDAREMRISIGKGNTATHIRAGTIAGMLGRDISGTFSDTDADIANVPLELTKGTGKLRFSGSVLDLQADNWRLSDREKRARFEPLVTHDAQLRLADGVITANAVLHEPETDVEVVAVDIRHDLSRSRGGANLQVRGIDFDDKLQPEMLTGLALGVVANVKGRVEGRGRIDWNSEGVTSTGRFSTDNTDLAAAFGPVEGLSGTIEFSDLLGLETKAGQIARIRQVNPGIAVEDGIVHYQLISGQRMKIEGGEWPFSGGTLFLEPTILNFSRESERHLVFRIEDMDAARFLLRFDFDNITASGIFDGRLPMVFDQNGGRIENGRLDVRSGGGTLAYVGQLSNENLGAMANFAFNALKSMRYKEMTVRMNGPLDGEIVTEVNFAGIQQGEGAAKNFITRQLAKLPIEFNIRIAAPFMQLIGSARSLYDAKYLLDPVSAGVVRGFKPGQLAPVTTPLPATKPEDDNKDNKPVQPSESDPVP